ncbi:MAG TPA: beta-propeller fold lactonase family protein [Actinomycetota bacterium]|nr:beta-propeller fold lactonase family protein [Actinomycetota bacterium]
MRRPLVPILIAAVVFLVAVLLATQGGKKVATTPPPATPIPQASFVPGLPTPTESVLPGMPPLLNPTNIYAADAANQFSPTVKGYPSLIYVPNTLSNSVDVIDPKTDQIVEHFAVGKDPEHVVPAWDLKTLYVTSDEGNSLTPIDASTGRPGPAIRVEDPYNLYFTPDGQYAIVVAERLKELNFANPSTWQVTHSLPVPCKGVDHIDFSADGTYLLATCEFGGNLIKVDVATQQVVASLQLPSKGRTLAQPQDIKLSPDGKTFYVADMTAGGVYLVNGATMTQEGFLPTGKNAHGLYVSRDAQDLYVANRGSGSVSVVSFANRQVAATWSIPGGGSPDMGGVSADGSVLWLSGRYNSEVYGFNTTTGALVARIPVGSGPHGLCVYPQPGRYSLGHTGILR